MRHSFFIIALALAFFAGRTLRADVDTLNGMAAIIDAGAPIALGGIQAGADQSIAGINADAAVEMTQINSDTTKYLANQQSNVALYQARTAMEVNNENQQAVTERLAMQLGQLADARHEAEATEQQKLFIEEQYNNQRLALARQQSATTFALAKEQLELQATIAGLQGQSFGYGSSQLTLQNNGPAGGSASLLASNAAASTATDVSVSPGADASTDDSGGSGSTPALPPLVPTVVPRSVAPNPIVVNPVKPRAVGPRSSKLPARLLASVGNRGARSAGSKTRGAVVSSTLAPGSFKAPAPNRGLASESNAARIAEFVGRPHATSGHRASTTVSSGESDDAAESTEVVSFSRHKSQTGDSL